MVGGRHVRRGYRGVSEREDGRWDAEITLEDGERYHIGTFDMDFQAARAYDEWAELLEIKTPNRSEGAEWISPGEKESESESLDDIFPLYPGEMFTVDEIVRGLEQLNAEDVVVLDLKDKGGAFADYFVIVTGKSVPHMRKMMDTLLRALKARKIRKLRKRNLIVEGRDTEDWMLVDCETIVVHAFEKNARKLYNLEDHWTNMRPDGTNSLYDGMDLDELCAAFPSELEDKKYD